MIQDRLIVCIASSWDYDPTSKHHIMRILARKNVVLWVNYHGTRRPQANGHDFRAAWSALRRVVRGPQSAGPSIVQFTPLVLPGATRPALRRLHQRMLIGQIRRAVRGLDPRRERPVQVWTFAPDVPFLRGCLNEERFVYYCVDEYRQFEDFDAEQIAAAEDRMLACADRVVTTSAVLFDTKRRHRPDAVLVRHGVDYDHFASAWRSPPPRPLELAEIPRPMFGFFGLIHHWIDCPMLVDVARLRPQYSFVLIGDTKVDVGDLRRLHNVYLLGRRRYEDLPAYCAAFDAGLLPFVRNTMTRNINPIKMCEYLAAGLPIVSTSLPEAIRRGGPISFGDTPDTFAHACDVALMGDHPGRRQTISATVQADTWESRVEQLSAVVMGRLTEACREQSEVAPPLPSLPAPVSALAGEPRASARADVRAG